MDELFKEYEGLLSRKILDDIQQNLPEKVTKAQLKKILDLSVLEYQKASVEPGESVGLVSAESIGEPGTQMCIAHDEQVIIKQEGAIDIVPIGEFVDSILDSRHYPVGHAKGYEFASIDGVSVLALNDGEKMEWKPVSKVNRIKSPQKLIRITTKSGRSVTATDYHSFVTRKNNALVSIAGKDLTVGNRIPSIRYLPEHCIDAIQVSEYVDLPAADDARVARAYRPTKLLPSELQLDWGFGWFVGAYLAEGSAALGHVSISNLNDLYINHAKEFARRIGLDFVEKRHHRGFAESRDFIINASLLARFLRNSCGAGSSNKKVPMFAYSAKAEFVAGLLRGYFDGDGNVTVKRKMIRASSNSESLIDGIKALLTRFGIFAFKSRDYKQHYLIIPSKYAAMFLQKIGSDITYKRNALVILAGEGNHQDYTDIISGFDTLLIDVSRKLGLPTRYVNSSTKRQKIGRTALLRHIETFGHEAEEKNVDISREMCIMKQMAASDIVWDEIERIEPVVAEHEYVYDLTVPELHTFTTFDGIVVHNTLNTFHYAGVAEMNVTTGLPRLIEILDGRKLLSTPMMEIYLKKPYSEGKDIKKIALRVKETAVGDVVSEFEINLAESSVEIKANEERLAEMDLNKKAIVKAIEKGLKLSVKEKDDLVIVKANAKESSLNDVYKLKEKIKSVYLEGVKGILQVLPVKRGSEFIIMTAGSNLKKVLELDFVDETRTTSNDVFEIAEVLGVEAARQAIINEIFKVIDSQGLNIDRRHIMLVADTMCTSGRIRGITR
ncbi:intein-containing DNA-directed RNA polymerase subunit A'', partial [Candidatus Woesearchaeota archaeon]|nr:intein-containing DNA-directed RNA polymerase subunit A'' [Candidatus Woesearchaeota archaeon]